MPTRCSGWMPSAMRPAARASTRSPACFQVTDSHASPRGKRKASASGVAVTRSKNWTATLAGIVSRKAVSMVVGICYLLIHGSVTRRATQRGQAGDLACNLDHWVYRAVGNAPIVRGTDHIGRATQSVLHGLRHGDAAGDPVLLGLREAPIGAPGVLDRPAGVDDHPHD